MVDTDILQRKDYLLLEGDIVSVLSISKTSLRVYNITKDNYVPLWMNNTSFEYLPLSEEVIEMVQPRLDLYMYEGGVYGLPIFTGEIIEVRYAHELQRALAIRGSITSI